MDRNTYTIEALDDNFILTRRPSVIFSLAGLEIHELQFRSDANKVIGHVRPRSFYRSVFCGIIGALALMAFASLLIGVYVTFFEHEGENISIRLVSFLIVYPLMIAVFYLMLEGVVLMYRFWWWTGKWFRKRLYEDLLQAADVNFADEENA